MTRWFDTNDTDVVERHLSHGKVSKFIKYVVEFIKNIIKSVKKLSKKLKNSQIRQKCNQIIEEVIEKVADCRKIINLITLKINQKWLCVIANS